MSGDKDSEEPEVQLELQKEKPQEKAGLSAAVLYSILAWVGCGAALLMFNFGGGGLTGAPGFQQGSGDKVGTAQRAEIDGKFAAYTGRLEPLALTDENLRAEFLASPYLSPQEKESLLADIDDGKRRVSVITLWDNFDEDGDVVTIEANGVTLTVPIMHAPVRVFVPYAPGGVLSITGTRDGTGGITAAVETSAGAVPLPILGVGQTIVLPLM